jgi:hypothetical protein
MLFINGANDGVGSADRMGDRWRFVCHFWRIR